MIFNLHNTLAISHFLVREQFCVARCLYIHSLRIGVTTRCKLRPYKRAAQTTQCTQCGAVALLTCWWWTTVGDPSLPPPLSTFYRLSALFGARVLLCGFPTACSTTAASRCRARCRHRRARGPAIQPEWFHRNHGVRGFVIQPRGADRVARIPTCTTRAP